MPTTAGRARAASSTASTNRAACTSASRRPAIGVVPAWFDSPSNTARQRLPRRQHVGDPEHLAAIDQRLALLDVHLEEAADALRSSARLASSDSRVTPWICGASPIDGQDGVDVELPVMAWLAKHELR